MHIKHVEIENFKRLRAVDVDTSGSVITIGGNNAQGKSSFIDAIWNTLGGKQKAVEMPIRAGESKASSMITLEAEDGTGLVATRIWKGDRSTVKLRVKGSKADLDKPQEILNDLIGPFSFDPVAFATMPEKKRRDTLVDLVGVDVTEIDSNIDDLRAERLLVGRDRDRVKGALAEAESPAANLPENYVSVTDLISERDETARVAAGIERFQGDVQGIDSQIEALQQQRADLQSKIQKGMQWLDGRRGLGVIRSEIDNAESTNQAINAASEYRRLKADFTTYDDTYDALTGKINAAEDQKAALLAETKLPIEGLSFDDESVYYNDVPFSQVSAAERIRICFAMAVAYEPNLRVVCIKDASLLDGQSLALLHDLAEQHGVQLFLEMVGANDDYTVVLEDGEVKS